MNKSLNKLRKFREALKNTSNTEIVEALEKARKVNELNEEEYAESLVLMSLSQLILYKDDGRTPSKELLEDIDCLNQVVEKKMCLEYIQFKRKARSEGLRLMPRQFIASLQREI